MNRYVSFLSVVLFVTSCHASISEEGLTISLFSRPDLKWTWVESGKEEIAQKTVLYEELFGTRNSLRLNQSMSVHLHGIRKSCSLLHHIARSDKNSVAFPI